jgi:glycosyltransferase involved in cell wall biosynthesis
LKVAIDVQVTPNISGGIAQAVMCLVRDLGKLRDGSETYTIIVQSDEQAEWLKKVLGPNQQLLLRDRSLEARSDSERRYYEKPVPGFLKSAMGPFLPTGRYLRKLVLLKLTKWSAMSVKEYLKNIKNIPRQCFNAPVFNAFYDGVKCDVLHVPTQNFALSAMPTIYNPHDLQHRHYPEFFTATELAWRESVYSAGCHFAQTVVVGSQWTKNDVVRQYGVDPEKVQVILEGPPTQGLPALPNAYLDKIKGKYELVQPFAFYPAVTWPHKNHIRLLEALAYLRDNLGLEISLVCPGSRFEGFWPNIERRIEELRLESQVRFLGFVPEEDLRALYRLSHFLVQPSLFEASSLPIFEAWLEGIPVACSNVTALPDQVLDAAVLFDPNDVELIADAIAKLATNEKLRQDYIEKGYRRLKDFDTMRTARAYRAVYRRAGGFPLTEEDRSLLG